MPYQVEVDSVVVRPPKPEGVDGEVDGVTYYYQQLIPDDQVEDVVVEAVKDGEYEGVLTKIAEAKEEPKRRARKDDSEG